VSESPPLLARLSLERDRGRHAQVVELAHELAPPLFREDLGLLVLVSEIGLAAAEALHSAADQLQFHQCLGVAKKDLGDS
jgi:hypothetical protein